MNQLFNGFCESSSLLGQCFSWFRMQTKVRGYRWPVFDQFLPTCWKWYPHDLRTDIRKQTGEPQATIEHDYLEHGNQLISNKYIRNGWLSKPTASAHTKNAPDLFESRRSHTELSEKHCTAFGLRKHKTTSTTASSSHDPIELVRVLSFVFGM